MVVDFLTEIIKSAREVIDNLNQRKKVGPVKKVVMEKEVGDKLKDCRQLINDAIEYNDYDSLEEWRGRLADLDKFTAENDIELTGSQKFELRRQLDDAERVARRPRIRRRHVLKH